MVAAFDYTVYLALFIPILVIFMGILFGMLLAYLNYLKRKNTCELLHKERLAAIEKGMEPPPISSMPFREETAAFGPPRPRRDLLTGLIWLFLGIAVLVFLAAQNGDVSPMAGLIGVGIGLAYLIYYAIEGRRHVTPPPPRPPSL